MYSENKMFTITRKTMCYLPCIELKINKSEGNLPLDMVFKQHVEPRSS